MINLEKECKWHFAPQIGGREDGPNDPMEDNFMKTPYASLIRESIQNSLDVCLDDSKPIRMEFSITRIRPNEYANFFNLKNHVEGCLEHFKENDDAKTTYQPMIDYFNSLGPLDALHYIKISDYNTCGMEYVKGDTTKPFYAFVRAAGVSSKQNSSAGGSFGFGKAAYFYMSPLRTVFVSTKTKDDNFFFEGVSSLCTHTLKDKEDLFVSVGYYDNNDGEPITEQEKIPERFIRNEAGTDIYILGIDGEDRHSIYDEMIKAVLRNFWLAIFEEKLEVKIKDIEITSENLQEIMQSYFKDEVDKTRTENNYNPVPYLDAVMNTGNDNRHIFIQDTLPIIGKVRFYAFKDKMATDKILYMRKPLMLVKAKRTRSSNGFYGVFICDDEKGNELLRKVENPAHNEWKFANWKENGKNNPEAKKVIEDVQNFIIKVMDQLFSDRNNEVQNITGLEDFLYIPTAVEEDDLEDESLVGDVIDQRDEDGNSLTTTLGDFVQSQVKDKSSIGKVMIESTDSKHTPDKHGKDLGGHGDGKKKVKGGGGVSPGKIDSRYTKNPQGVDGLFLSEVSVRYRSFAQIENGRVIHTIVIHSDYEFKKGRIDLLVGGDQSDDVVKIQSCSIEGIIKENVISNIHIMKGKNIIKIQFADNMKHAVKLDAYELK